MNGEIDEIDDEIVLFNYDHSGGHLIPPHEDGHPFDDYPTYCGGTTPYKGTEWRMKKMGELDEARGICTECIRAWKDSRSVSLSDLREQARSIVLEELGEVVG